MNPLNYIIVQAGGRGTRMECLTRNKPKALISVNKVPILFHLFRLFPKKKFIIIGDWQFDVLKRYLSTFADVDYELVCASGNSGTCAGLNDALLHIPEHERFMLIWSDLVLPKDYKLPETEENSIGISHGFSCRWSYENGAFREAPSKLHGVAGQFIFREKSLLQDIPPDGEFVRWLSESDIRFDEQVMIGATDYGTYDVWANLPERISRPFNQLTIEDDRVYKKGIDEQGRILAKREIAWYKRLQGEAFEAIPQIYSWDPFCMERIMGKPMFDYLGFSEKQKAIILEKLINVLKDLHAVGNASYDERSFREAYIDTCFDRLEKIKDLVPFANDPVVYVNGKACQNVFFHRAELEELIMQYRPKKFVFLHGDCSFSNVLLKDDAEPILIDPRGYFGSSEFFGDAAYDWVKLYYSLIGNYDQFNLMRFSLDIRQDGARIEVASNHWEGLEDRFFELLEGEVTRKQMKVLLAITWLRLTTYVWDDYDSICGAFYLGLYYLEEAFEMHCLANVKEGKE